MFINHKVYDYGGNYIGAIGVGLGVKTVKGLIEKYQQNYGRTIFFTDRQGQITLMGNAYNGPDKLNEIPGLAPFVTQLLTSPVASLNYKQERSTVYVNSRFVPEFDWYLVVLQQNAPGEIRIMKALRGNVAIGLCMTLVILLIANFTIGSYQKKLETMATTDKLTGLANRQIFDFLFTQTLKTNERQKSPLSMVLIDVDHFKQVNDTHGHAIGDKTLQEISTILQELVRGADVVFRWGGEEFLLLLSNCNRNQAAQLAERTRNRIQKQTLSYGKEKIQVTISLGVAEIYPRESSGDFIERADKALYRAKNAGRNRVEVAV